MTNGVPVALFLHLLGNERAPKAARAILRDFWKGNAFDESCLDDLLLVTSELVTNAILHTASGDGGMVVLAVQVRPSCVRIEVTDEGSPTEPRVGPPEVFTEGGKGLALVAALTDEWSFAPLLGTGGRTVIAERALPE
ncbi:ATP-binding protein [Spongiactinospora sp. TRM90649]|uniref:ATP-binding protein n=1 Tax=Spongiactinospora sp. TRM90649 TaxID=3031114 RepID=UPI0023F66F8B|nr:ATP-binding protein [Spongiactinospora sp. TRM90649]MDF5753860.1 ATP-binding protein [Spongiactinospora sp. TRM90649]